MLNRLSLSYNDISVKVRTDIYNALPNKPYCSNSKRYTIIRSKYYAQDKPYIQINNPNLKRYLIVDIDESDAYSILLDSRLPQPTYISINRVNGHLQCAWKLRDAVSTSYNSRVSPMKFLAAIDAAYNYRLNGDASFGDCLAKNPLHEHWYNEYYDTEYTLHELADYVDLSEKDASNIAANDDVSGLGRNNTVFDIARKKAYKMVRKAVSKPLFQSWQSDILASCESLNKQFSIPMQHNEVKNIARSIARYTFKMWAQFVHSMDNFRAVQAVRGAIGGKRGSNKALSGAKGGTKSKRSGSVKKECLLSKVLAMKSQRYNHRAIAEDLNISASTVSLWLKAARS
ncbi:replication initiation protein [Moritella viscosa]|uniref:replication initiation protein n=1 Tax=Moritella viscosa TaxID=80854 RepID=UPI00091325CF|nr:replication initiation protein [Moritella viscosa]SHO15400.1 Plasmid replicase [Moritella viscosa]SHO17863.1 Plasmid replicase [Moritella viscosa]SHO19043.1 Plasmid replicase [Moritella viscosa]